MEVGSMAGLLAAGGAFAWLEWVMFVFIVLIGFSIIIFFHELGHFLAAKWVGVRVHRFAVGFGKRVMGFRKGEGFTFGSRPEYTAEELANRKYGETDYCFNLLPIGGYVKLLGQEDIMFDEKDNPVFSTDPRAFNNRTVGQRMFVVSMGVVFNILFAAIVFIAVFLLGQKMEPPVVGELLPGSPARGKLIEGDRIISINGSRVDNFQHVVFQTMFADAGQPLRLRIKRDGKLLPDEIIVTPTIDSPNGPPQLGIFPLTSTKSIRDGVPVEGKPNLKAGDEITHVDGNAVSGALEIRLAFRASGGRIVELKVRRPDPTAPGGFRDETVYQRARLIVLPSELAVEREVGAFDSDHLLGLQRRRVVGEVVPRTPAQLAGFQDNDVVVEWGDIPNPTHAEIRSVNAGNENREIRIVVERKDERVELHVTPKRPFKLFGDPEEAKAGVSLTGGIEADGPVVAAVAKGSPAEALQIPRGAKVLTIDGQRVLSWFDVAAVFKASAGREVEVRFVSNGVESSGRMNVPSSFVNELELPDDVNLESIDGQSIVRVPGRDGKEVEYSVRLPAAARRFLSEKVGQTVKLRYARTLTGTPEERDFTVRADNIDPWQLRLVYSYDVDRFEFVREPISANGNPLTALMMGVREVKRIVQMVYVTLTKLATRSNAAEQVAGPIGIVSIGVQTARSGLPDFLWFLAILSINLAVINFLPMPVMDGGLMVFLLIEKIKGKPLSFGVQMWTTLVGLAAIILIGVLVTIQDITRLF